MRIASLATLLWIATQAQAAVGWRYEGDLNGDGQADRLESGPITYFSPTGNGPWVLTLSSPDGSQRFDLEGTGTFALERFELAPDTVRLWGHFHSGGGESGLMSYTIRQGKMTLEHLTINPIDGGNGLSNKISELIFSKPYLIDLKKLDDYTPPPGPASGGKWEP